VVQFSHSLPRNAPILAEILKAAPKRAGFARLGSRPDHAEAFAARRDVVFDQGGGERSRESLVVELDFDLQAVLIAGPLPAVARCSKVGVRGWFGEQPVCGLGLAHAGLAAPRR
jgi:hypothetical protein